MVPLVPVADAGVLRDDSGGPAHLFFGHLHRRERGLIPETSGIKYRAYLANDALRLQLLDTRHDLRLADTQI